MAMATSSACCAASQSLLSSSSSSLFASTTMASFSSTKHCHTRKNSVAKIVASARDASSASVRDFVLSPFASRKAFKVISGLQNFDEKNVASVVIAAEKGGATHVDIACTSDLVKLAISLTSLPVCVSAIDPEAFLPALEAGAHMVEIGNYDSFYQKNNRIFSSNEVLQLAVKTRKLLPEVVLSVTVPHTLNLVEQVELAEMLEKEGVDIIQTEGGTSSKPVNPGVHGLIEKASPTLASAFSISRAVSIPVMCASGLSDVTAPMAIAAGAAGVGVGSAISKLHDQIAMIAAVQSIADALCVPTRSSFSTVSRT